MLHWLTVSKYNAVNSLFNKKKKYKTVQNPLLGRSEDICLIVSKHHEKPKP